MVTIADIAAQCGVSKATVSKALNGADDIGAATAAQIRECARSLGYLPNASARALKSGKSHNIGVLFVDRTSSGLTHEYFSHILENAKAAAEAHGYDITFISRGLGNMGMDYLEHARYRSCDGVIIASVDFTDPAVIRLVNSPIPTVTIDYVFNGRSSILSDNVHGPDELVRYVYGLGHRKIACIHGEMTTVTDLRLKSFRRTCLSLGLKIPEEYIKEALFHDPRSSGLATRALLELKDRPTCILYPDDYSFIGGMNELERQGLRIPEDMSVCGYDGIPLSEVLRPKLTTYRQNAEMIGRTASEKLIELIEKPDLAMPEQITVTGALLPGGTVKKIGVQ